MDIKQQCSYGTNVILLCRTIRCCSYQWLILNVYHTREATRPQTHDVMLCQALFCHTACNPQHAWHVNLL
jgi:hypothetical protein